MRNRLFGKLFGGPHAGDTHDRASRASDHQREPGHSHIDDLHDDNQRLIDLCTVVALLLLVLSGYHYFVSRADTPTDTSFIVPSQSVRW